MMTDDLFERIAEMNGVSIEEVKEEMQKSIQEAAMNASPEFRESFGDEAPSIEDFLSAITSNLTDTFVN